MLQKTWASLLVSGELCCDLYVGSGGSCGCEHPCCYVVCSWVYCVCLVAECDIVSLECCVV